jgi:LPXTG-motif cell wall-anchored protein
MQRADTQQHQHTARRRRAIIGVVAMSIGAVVTTVSLSAGSTLAFDGPEEIEFTPESNEPEFWGEGCTKLDEGIDDTQWVADADYSTVVLKAANTNYVFTNVEEGDVLIVGDNDISHFIFCPPTATTTTAATTTTTVAATTTTVAATTTTVGATTTTTAATTTTVADTPTTVQQAPPTTLVGSAGPTTVAAELPATGPDRTGVAALIGTMLLGLGLLLVVSSRRPTIS